MPVKKKLTLCTRFHLCSNSTPTLTLLTPGIWGLFTRTKRLYNTSWASDDLTPFWHIYTWINVCLFIYLAALGLSFATQDLGCITWDCSLWPTDSLAVAHRLSWFVAWGILVPWPGIKPASLALQGGFWTTREDPADGFVKHLHWAQNFTR